MREYFIGYALYPEEEDDDFEEIATETNRYAEQYFENNQNRGTFSRFRKWQNTCASEIKRYTALILAMGIISQSDINEYWSTDAVTSTPFFPATMSRYRFLLITSFLHLANNDDFIPCENPGHNYITHYLNSDLFSNYDISFQICLHLPSKHFVRRRNDSVERELIFSCLQS